MFDNFQERLHALRVWHTLRLERIDAKIAALRQPGKEERGRRNHPAPPDWVVELGIGAGRPPLQIHAGDCHMAGKRHRAVSHDETRRLIATGLPETRPDILDVAGKPHHRTARTLAP